VSANGWQHAQIEAYKPAAPFDVVVCYDVLQYLDSDTANRALANFGKLCRGVLYFTALTPRGLAAQLRSEPHGFQRPLAKCAVVSLASAPQFFGKQAVASGCGGARRLRSGISSHCERLWRWLRSAPRSCARLNNGYAGSPADQHDRGS